MQKNSSSSLIKALIASTIFDGKPLIEITNNHISTLKEGLFSRNSKMRKATTTLLFHLSNQNSQFLELFKKKRLLHTFEGYTGISFDVNGDLSDPRDFLRLLKRDKNFLKEETKCNRFLVKHMKNTQDPSKAGKVNLVTMTELKYFLKNKFYNKMPDPMSRAIWFYKEEEKIIPTNLEFSDEIKRLKEKKLRKKMRKLRQEKASQQSSSGSDASNKGIKKRCGLKIRLRSSESKDREVKRKSFQVRSKSNSIGNVWKRQSGGRRPISYKKKRISTENEFVSPSFQRRLFLSRSAQRKLKEENKRKIYSFPKQKGEINKGKRMKSQKRKKHNKIVLGVKKKLTMKKPQDDFLIRKTKGDMKKGSFQFMKKYTSDRVIRKGKTESSKPNRSIDLTHENTGSAPKGDKKKSFFFKVSKRKQPSQNDSDH